METAKHKLRDSGYQMRKSGIHRSGGPHPGGKKDSGEDIRFKERKLNFPELIFTDAVDFMSVTSRCVQKHPHIWKLKPFNTCTCVHTHIHTLTHLHASKTGTKNIEKTLVEIF